MITLIRDQKHVDDIVAFTNYPEYNYLELDAEEIGNIYSLIRQKPNEWLGLVSYKDDELTGFAIALAAKYPFSKKVVATEIALEATNPKHFVHLFQTFEYWAEKCAKVDLIQTGLMVSRKPWVMEKFYKRYGYKESERFFRKELR